MSRIEFTHGWSTMTEGRYWGYTLPQVLFKDPNWFFKAYREGQFDDLLLTEAQELYEKATHIRIPQRKGWKLAEYGFRSSSRFRFLNLVRTRSVSDDGYTIRRKAVITLRAAFVENQLDKHGGKRMLRHVKEPLFGSVSHRMTKRRCEEFYSNEDNFDLATSDEDVELEEEEEPVARPKGKQSGH